MGANIFVAMIVTCVRIGFCSGVGARLLGWIVRSWIVRSGRRLATQRDGATQRENGNGGDLHWFVLGS